MKSKQLLLSVVSGARDEGAQSLVELVIVIGIAVTAMTAILVLFGSSFIISQESSDRTRALNLAREGVEVVRNLRDGNWLKRQRNELVSAGGGGVVYEWDEGLALTGTYAVRFDARFEDVPSGDDILIGLYPLDDADIETCMNDSACRLSVITDNPNINEPAPGAETPIGLIVPDQFVQDIDMTGAVLTPTIFHRMVRIEHIQGIEPTSPPNRDEDDIAHIRVISQVAWRERREIRRVEVEEWLYDWQTQEILQ